MLKKTEKKRVSWGTLHRSFKFGEIWKRTERVEGRKGKVSYQTVQKKTQRWGCIDNDQTFGKVEKNERAWD